jgi:hypothetical protein
MTFIFCAGHWKAVHLFIVTGSYKNGVWHHNRHAQWALETPFHSSDRKQIETKDCAEASFISNQHREQKEKRQHDKGSSNTFLGLNAPRNGLKTSPCGN